MVGELDTSALNPGSFMSLRDALAGNAAQDQKLQAGQLANEQAKNQYASQVMSMATSTGNQDLYNSAKAHLNNLGVDMSGWADDVTNGAQQAQSLRLAMSPLGSLLNAGAKMDANTIAANSAAGKATPQPNAMTYAVMRNSFVQQGGEPAGQQFDKFVQAGQVPGISMPAPGSAAGNPPPLSSPQSADNKALDAVKNGAPVPAIAPAAPVNLPAIDANGSTVANFVPPANDPTKTQAANQQAIEDAQKAWESRADVKQYSTQATEAAKETGQSIGEMPQKTAAANELVQRIDQNLNGMLQANPNVPSSKWGVNAEQRAWLSQNFGSLPIVGDNGDANYQYNAFSKVNKAQVLNGIQELVQSGSIRNSKALIQLVDNVNAIDINASPESRAQQIEAIRAELHNLATSTSNIQADMTGGTKMPYQKIPVTTPTTTTNGWSYGGIVKQ